MIRIEDIIEIRKAIVYDRGYEIVFPNNKIIWLTKRRTIAGLLLLIKYESCSEEDLVGANNRLREIKQILQGKYNESWIKDRYGDANKPFSELWTEEGFSCVHAEGLQCIRTEKNRTNKEMFLLITAQGKEVSYGTEKGQICGTV